MIQNLPRVNRQLRFKILDLNAGSLRIYGKHTGQGTFVAKLYDLEQNLIAEMVNIEGYGEYDQTTQTPPGYYYLIVQKSDGKFDLNYEY